MSRPNPLRPNPRAFSTAAAAGLAIAGAALLTIGFTLGRMTSVSVTSAGSPNAPIVEQVATPSVASGANENRAGRGWSIEPSVIDFGVLDTGAEVTGVFTITNTTPDPLTIVQMKPSCKCTTLGEYNGRAIAPGESLEITTVLDARSYAARTKSRIDIIFDGYEEIGQVELIAETSRAVRATPPYLSIQGMAEGTVLIESRDGDPFNILTAGGDPPVFVGGFDPSTDAPQARYEIAFDLSEFDDLTCENAEGDRTPMWWVIETDHPSAPILDLRVRHDPCTLLEFPSARAGERHWFLSENRIVVDEVKAGEPIEFEVYLKWVKDISPNDEIRVVTSESGALEAELLGIERDNGRITCKVRVTPDSKYRGLLYAPIRFHGFIPGHSMQMVVIGRVVDA